MNIFQLSDYKNVLRQCLLERKEHVAKSFTFQIMATACRIQKAYLSKVLNGDGHLNDDQIFMACRFLGFSHEETDFTLALYHFEKSTFAERRTDLSRKIQRIRESAGMTHKHIQADSQTSTSPEFTEYYLDTYLPIVHMFLTINRYAENVSLIAKDLRLKAATVTDALRKMQRLGIIEIVDGRYSVKIDHIHLPSDSPVFRTYQSLVKLRTIERLQSVERDGAYSFSVIFSTSEDVRRRIKQRFLDFLKQAEHDVETGPQDHVFQMNFDLFGWSCD